MSQSVAQEFTVRLAGPADAGQLSELAVRTFRDTYAEQNRPENMVRYLAEHFSPEHQGEELADPAMATVVAEEGSRLIGYAQLRAGNPPACVPGTDRLEVSRFYVDRPWHGRGVAQALIRATVAEAARRGARTLWLGVWERNPRGIAFYRKCGFADVGAQTFLLGTDRQDDRVMALALV
ncbi:MAG TPA: GNAT family N-acetyltransferase [Gemmatimonadales bacterium]|nr:GNAT family N-acetyltransferase [Gemmatimonadales bacterium]